MDEHIDCEASEGDSASRCLHAYYCPDIIDMPTLFTTAFSADCTEKGHLGPWVDRLFELLDRANRVWARASRLGDGHRT